MIDVFIDRYVYFLVVVLLAIGLYGVLVSRHLVKKVMGLLIFQTGVFLFFVEGSVKDGATLPVITDAIGTDAESYVNPLPHLLILTAIVVGVAVLGVAFALLTRIHRVHGTLDEDEVARQLALPSASAPPSANPEPDGGR